MAQIKTISLSNYKGVRQVVIDFVDRSHCPVTTLIGLNESGKTTILEGLSNFVTGDKSVSMLFAGIHSQASGVSLIPIHKKAAFTGKIEISAQVTLEDGDLNKIKEIASSAKLTVDEELLKKPIEVTKSFRFEDSSLKATNHQFSFDLWAKTPRATKYKKYGPGEHGEIFDFWRSVADAIQQGMPHISYFPTFLVDMPSRIYLKAHDGERAVNRHYRAVFQDILDSMNENLSLDRHVSDRIENFKKSEKSPNWFSMFFAGPNRTPVDSVFQKISNAVTKEVLGSWQRVFQRAISAKSIFVDWGIDAEKGDLPYASFNVSDGESRYAISERSLGFRWFFSFLLFTSFKRAKGRGTIFVFDEPAANLHAKAQAELLTSFSRMAADGH